jgi:hypothetical protein
MPVTYASRKGIWQINGTAELAEPAKLNNIAFSFLYKHWSFNNLSVFGVYLHDFVLFRQYIVYIYKFGQQNHKHVIQLVFSTLEEHFEISEGMALQCDKINSISLTNRYIIILH